MQPQWRGGSPLLLLAGSKLTVCSANTDYAISTLLKLDVLHRTYQRCSSAKQHIKMMHRQT